MALEGLRLEIGRRAVDPHGLALDVDDDAVGPFRRDGPAHGIRAHGHRLILRIHDDGAVEVGRSDIARRPVIDHGQGQQTRLERHMGGILKLIFRRRFHLDAGGAKDRVAREVELVHIEGERPERLDLHRQGTDFGHDILVAAVPFAQDAELDGDRPYVGFAPLVENVALKLGVGEALGEDAVVFDRPHTGIEVIPVDINLGDIGRDVVVRHFPGRGPFEGQGDLVEFFPVQFNLRGRSRELHLLFRLEKVLSLLQVVDRLLTGGEAQKRENRYVCLFHS